MNEIVDRSSLVWRHLVWPTCHGSKCDVFLFNSRTHSNCIPAFERWQLAHQRMRCSFRFVVLFLLPVSFFLYRSFRHSLVSPFTAAQICTIRVSSALKTVPGRQFPSEIEENIGALLLSPVLISPFMFISFWPQGKSIAQVLPDNILCA